MVYAGKDGPVTTLRMEMLHAGIEDFLLWKRLPVAHRRRLASSLIGLRVGSASHCSGDALWQPKNTDVIFGTCMLGDAEDLEAKARGCKSSLEPHRLDDYIGIGIMCVQSLFKSIALLV